MKNSLIISLLILCISVFSCGEKSEEVSLKEQLETLEPKINFVKLDNEFRRWWTYQYKYISLSSNFNGLNEQSVAIDKKQFLEKLISGQYIPLRLKSIDGVETYKLHKIGDLADKSVGEVIKNEALTALLHYELEGQDFPPFDFTDLNDNHYTNENTKGKIMVLKTWFIACTACVAEFPELNEWIKNYEDRNDIVFVSLALDPKSKLEEFLKTKEFEYQVVPNQGKLIWKELKLQIFPTHIIVDKNGTIVKVVNKASEMISFLNNEEALFEDILPPPPPPTL